MSFYRTDRQAIPLLLAIFSFWEIAAYSEAVSVHAFIGASVGMGSLVFILLILITVFSYASIAGPTLKFVYLFFYRRTIDIDCITEITNRPTYIAAQSQFRSLFILYKDKTGQETHIELRITIFPEAELARLIRDLQRLNPNIHLDSYSARLATTASGH